jgi:beta-catenin-like protein 1
MSSIDDLFRRPNAPPKRKLEDPNASFRSKSTKLANGTSPHGTARSQPPPASVEDETQEQGPEDDDDDDMEAGPALPPDEDEEDEAGDDEEGRFFGSGVTDNERQALNILNENDAAEDGPEETIDLTWLKRTALSFERKINKNAELRAKYADDPLKFVASEADLDADIKTLSLLSEYPSLYAQLVKSGSLTSLVQLLAHDNTDIAISAIQVLEELTDEDTSATPEQWSALTQSLLDSDVIDLLTSNLSRLNETTSETDRDGVYHILSLLENLLSSPVNHDPIGSHDSLLTYLLTRIKTPDASARAQVGQNRQYAAELLAILLQTSNSNRNRVAEQDGVDTILQLLAPYRSGDPERDSDEEEFVENLFDCLVCLVEAAVPSEQFIDAEGVELALIMLKDGKLSKGRALKVLDHAMGGAGAVSVCDKVVEAAGLKTIFGLLMKSKKGKSHGLERESVEHVIGILASLLKNTPANSAARIRTLAKFVEKEYEKVARLVELRQEYGGRVGRVEKEIEKEKQQQQQGPQNDDEKAELEDEWLSRRLDAGLFSLQTLDVILSWLIAEDAGAEKRIDSLLEKEGGKAALKKSLQAQLAGMDAVVAGADDGRDVLQALIQCL